MQLRRDVNGYHVTYTEEERVAYQQARREERATMLDELAPNFTQPIRTVYEAGRSEVLIRPGTSAWHNPFEVPVQGIVREVVRDDTPPVDVRGPQLNINEGHIEVVVDQ